MAAQVIGNDAAVAFGGTQGTFELNVFMPMMARNLLESIRLLANVCRVFADRASTASRPTSSSAGPTPSRPRRIGTSLNPYIGYEKAAAVIKRAVKENTTIRAIVLEEGLMSDEELTKALDIEAMTRGGIIK